MPQLTFTGMKIKDICSASNELKNEIERTMGSQRKNIKFDYIESINIDDGTIDEYFPKVELLTFPREQEVLDETAKAITEVVQKYGYPFVQVTFKVMAGAYFYENGVHY
jgi:hypothetical protein